MAQRQRLVVCLDGTWNTRDDSTNVFHHFSMVTEGPVPDARGGVINQSKEYIQGVGTGTLDSITGGGFGLGLEENVRKAYNWLVQNYNDGDGEDPDEIYIFGFSRGAYTARSLVGFIGACGLLRRGAPLTVNQLWQNYCLLGRIREERQSAWEIILPEQLPACRPITELIPDPWSNRTVNPGTLSDSERLLTRWSRRARITYLGIYDTVGAMGLDALAIPGVTSKLAMHHNLRPTTLIQRCRHALAMDEHRVSFRHNPFVQYVGHKSEIGEGDRAEHVNSLDDTSHSGRNRAMWWRKIEQRWFVGAHSNVGGGYPDNELAQIPFRWLFDGAREAESFRKDGKEFTDGLRSENFTSPISNGRPRIRDSYEEFAKPFWTQIVRGKRFYRSIAPEPQFKASRNARTGRAKAGSGFTLQTINERIDPSVYHYWREVESELPPNLVEYARRKIEEEKRRKPGDKEELPDKEELERIARIKPRHAWMNHALPSYTFLVFWTTCIAIGLEALNGIFLSSFEFKSLPVWLLCVAAFLFSIIDWAESRVNFVLALKPSTPPGRAFLDSIYWTRSLGFITFVIGAISAFLWTSQLGWSAAGEVRPWRALSGTVVSMLKYWWPLPLCAGAGMFVAALFEDRTFKRIRFAAKALLLGSLATLALIPAVLGLGWVFGRIFAPVFGLPDPPAENRGLSTAFPGLLLFLEVAFIYVARAFYWTGEPLGKANLGSIVQLQFCLTPRRVIRCLERWRLLLSCTWDPRDKDRFGGPAAVALRDLIRQNIWRDVIGFIPTYTFVMAYGLWFSSVYLREDWLAARFWGIPLWFLIPMITALSDYIEDAVHLHFLSRHSEAKMPALGLTALGFIMATVKTVMFLIGSYYTLSAVIHGALTLSFYNSDTGWRGSLALLLPAAGVTLLGMLLVGIFACRAKPRPRSLAS